ncbi:hypothetical protein ZWY2020_047306 [Hordeum vulgare]|nr:hypothetical protein ZWY2020_047306 [Hordeum vulgare]
MGFMLRVRLASFFAGAAATATTGGYFLYKDYKLAHDSIALHIMEIQSALASGMCGAGHAVARWPRTVFMFRAMTFLFVSAAAHLLASHSRRFNRLFWQLNYAGYDGEFRNTGLERSKVLNKDLKWLSEQGHTILEPSAADIRYASYL